VNTGLGTLLVAFHAPWVDRTTPSLSPTGCSHDAAERKGWASSERTVPRPGRTDELERQPIT